MAGVPQPGMIQKMIDGISGKLGGRDSGAAPMDRVARMGLSARQQELNWLWSWYRCCSYDPRKVDWNGRPITSRLETEAIASQGFLPPGFTDGSGGSMPLKFRRPSAPYALAKVIVDRFTGLLFSERQHPQLHVEGDPQTEDFISTLVEVSRLWPSMMLARMYGGAMGTVAIGFQFLEGKPSVEVHDPRWLFPEFKDRATLLLKGVEKRYTFPQEVRDPESGRYETVQFWYRRIINETSDVVFKVVPVGNGDEPKWEVEAQVDHNLGFCPVVWVQNLPVQDDIDGDGDCHGVYDLVESIDALIAQANRALIANCDPTLVMTTKAEMNGPIKTGSDNAIRIPEGDAKFLEVSGSGPKAALDLAEQLRKYALEVAQCILENPDTSRATATEIERAFSSMLAKSDILREQYGERGLKPLVNMMVKAAQQLNTPVAGPDGQMVRQQLNLPPRMVAGADGIAQPVARTPGQGGTVLLRWPRYFQPTLADVVQAAQGAGAAKVGGLIDQEHASKFVAPFFGVEDVGAMLVKIEAEAAKQQGELEAMAMGGRPGGGGFG